MALRHRSVLRRFSHLFAICTLAFGLAAPAAHASAKNKPAAKAHVQAKAGKKQAAVASKGERNGRQKQAAAAPASKKLAGKAAKGKTTVAKVGRHAGRAAVASAVVRCPVAAPVWSTQAFPCHCTSPDALIEVT